MSNDLTRVKDAAALQLAIQQNARSIEVQGVIDDLTSLKLPAGTNLCGVNDQAELRFKEGQPGLMLSADHRVADLRLVTDETQIAVGLADDADDLGTLDLGNIRTLGRFHLEASRAKRGHLKLDRIHVERADARIAAHRPAGFGVEVLLGGLTVLKCVERQGKPLDIGSPQSFRRQQGASAARQRRVHLRRRVHSGRCGHGHGSGADPAWRHD